MSGHSLSWMEEGEEEESLSEEENQGDMNPSIKSLATMATLYHHQDEQEQLFVDPPSAAVARYYGYGEWGEGPAMERRNDSCSSNDSVPNVPGSPLPADRLARKQRNFPRRGGYCHSALLKSAVLACMSDGPETRSGMTESPDATSSTGDLSISDVVHGSGNNAASPRKRMRRTDRSTTAPTHHPQSESSMKESDEAVIARATDLLQRLCMKPLDQHSDGGSRHTHEESRHSRDGSGDFERKAPVRRVSRRTSYTSQISAGTDYDDLEDDDFL